MTTATPGHRRCANCACFVYMSPDGTVGADPSIGQPVCRRNPPMGRYTNADVAVFDAKGEPVLDRAGRPRVERRQVLQLGYPPVLADGVCFDGWRPAETLPGELWPWSAARRRARVKEIETADDDQADLERS